MTSVTFRAWQRKPIRLTNNLNPCPNVHKMFQLITMIRDSPLSEGNKDSPEAGLDALMQVFCSYNEISMGDWASCSGFWAFGKLLINPTQNNFEIIFKLLLCRDSNNPIGWRPNVKGMIVFITNAPSHLAGWSHSTTKTRQKLRHRQSQSIILNPWSWSQCLRGWTFGRNLEAIWTLLCNDRPRKIQTILDC